MVNGRVWLQGVLTRGCGLPGAGVGDVTVVVKDPQGRDNTVEVMMEDQGDATYRCTYRPTQTGPHAVAISFAGVAIPKSPFPVEIAPGKF